MKTWKKRLSIGILGLAYAAVSFGPAQALTVEELGTRLGEIATVDCAGVGIIGVDAGILKLNVDGVVMDGFCIDPFHFSDGSMPGYQAVPLTSAPKGSFMSATTALEIRRLWGSFYSSDMSDATAAGVQIAIWELTGGSGFKLVSANDYGAAGFLRTVEDPGYSGPLADLVGLTGTGQDYAVQSASLPQTIPDLSSTLALLALSLFVLFGASQQIPRLARSRV